MQDVSEDQVMTLAFCIALKKLKDEAPGAFEQIDAKMQAVVDEVLVAVAEEKKAKLEAQIREIAEDQMNLDVANEKMAEILAED